MFALAAFAVVAAPVHASAGRQSKAPVRERSAWKRYVIDPAHGWGGGPVPALSGYVLGIRPTAPGYRHWLVAPQPGDLRFAQGQAPTPHGPLASRWRREGGSFKLTVVAPKGTSGVVILPLPRHARAIAMDGKDVHAKRRGGTARVKVGAGQHTFVAG